MPATLSVPYGAAFGYFHEWAIGTTAADARTKSQQMNPPRKNSKHKPSQTNNVYSHHSRHWVTACDAHVHEERATPGGISASWKLLSYIAQIRASVRIPTGVCDGLLTPV